MIVVPPQIDNLTGAKLSQVRCSTAGAMAILGKAQTESDEIAWITRASPVQPGPVEIEWIDDCRVLIFDC